MSPVRTRDLLRVSARLALLQSTWCEGGMQSVGLSYSLIPGLSRLYPDQAELGEALGRHAEPVNTHPFLAGVIAGTTLRLEEERWQPRDLASFKRSVMGPLAAVGDPFFNGAATPFGSVLAILVALIAGPWAGIAALVVLFGALHTLGRFAGLELGYREGSGVVAHVTRMLSPARTRVIKYATAVGIGTIPAAVAFSFNLTASWWIAAALSACTLGVAFLLTRRQRSRLYLAPAALVVLLILEVLP